MKIIEIKEAKHIGGSRRPHPGYFVMDSSEPDNIKFVGPFSGPEEVHMYIKHMDSKYKDVSLTLEFGAVVTPEEHEKDIDQFHKWMFDET